jgi:hypothetical protein
MYRWSVIRSAHHRCAVGIYCHRRRCVQFSADRRAHRHCQPRPFNLPGRCWLNFGHGKRRANRHLQSLIDACPGFSGSASFACVGVPAAATCTAANVQLSAGTAVPYVVNVSTLASSMILLPPIAPQLPPFTWLRVVSLLACCCAFLLLLNLRHGKTRWGLLRVAALGVLVVLSVFHVAGCGGGGGGGVSPQVVPTPHVIGTPQGTSTITVTPTVTTSGGTPLRGIPPIQLTLTVQ